jgi:hypothetical protein
MLRSVALSLAIGTCVLASPWSYDAAMSAPKNKNQMQNRIANTYLCDERFQTRGRTEDTCLDRAGVPGLSSFAAAPVHPERPAPTPAMPRMSAKPANSRPTRTSTSGRAFMARAIPRMEAKAAALPPATTRVAAMIKGAAKAAGAARTSN